MKAPEGQWLVTSLSKKNKGEERKNEHRFWKTCKEALSRDTGQWNGNGRRAIWGWAHSHGILIQVKPMNLGQIYQHQSSPSRSHIEQKPLSKPQLPWKAEWSNFALTKLKLPHLSFPHLFFPFSTWMSVDPLTPLAEGVCRKSVNAEEDMNVAWLSCPYSEMFNSGCRQSTHWTREMVFKRKNRKLKWKTCEQYFHTHSWGLLPQSLTLGWVILQLSLWGYIGSILQLGRIFSCLVRLGQDTSI